MNEPVADYYLETEGTYQFVCSRCWTPQIITLAPSMLAPTCRCGFLLSVIAQFIGTANPPTGSPRPMAFLGDREES